MPQELIQVRNGRLTWHSAVSQVASALSPWGAAASIAAHMGACVSQIGQFKYEANRLARAHAIVTDEMKMRYALVSSEFEAQRQASMRAQLVQDAFLAGWANAIELSRDTRVSVEERLVNAGTLSIMTSQIPVMAALPGDQLVKFIKVLDLSRTEREVAALRQLGR